MASYATKLKRRYKALSSAKGAEYKAINVKSKAVILTASEISSKILADYNKGINSKPKLVTATASNAAKNLDLTYYRGSSKKKS